MPSSQKSVLAPTHFHTNTSYAAADSTQTSLSILTYAQCHCDDFRSSLGFEYQC